jgi:hypothetical protein
MGATLEWPVGWATGEGLDTANTVGLLVLLGAATVFIPSQAIAEQAGAAVAANDQRADAAVDFEAAIALDT